MLKYLNGVNNNNMNGIFDDFTTWKNNAIQNLPTPIKNAVNAAGSAARATFTVTFFAMRAAFLGLVNVNATGLAEVLERAIRKDAPKIKIFWESYGGTWQGLIDAVNNGIKAGQPGRPTKIIAGLGMGVEAAIALVTPILTSLAVIIKAIGGSSSDEKAVKDAAAAGTAAGQAGAASGTLPAGTTTGITLPASALPASALPTTSNLPLIIGGIAVLGLGAFLIMKKK
jgi:hypothetical protein